MPLTTKNQLRTELRQKVELYWDRYWNENNPCRQTKHFFPHINKKLAINLTKCRRNVFSSVVHLVTGHNFMARQESIVEYGEVIQVAAACPHCNNEDEEESSFHILAECEAFGPLRQSIWGTETLELPFDNLKNMQLVDFMRRAQLSSGDEIRLK